MFPAYRKMILCLSLIAGLCVSALRADDGDVPPAIIVEVEVSLDGKPLASGRIFYHLPEDQFVGGRITSGKCRLDHVPAGTWKVTIESKGMPRRYSRLEQAGLTVEIMPGNNLLVFELSSD